MAGDLFTDPYQLGALTQRLAQIQAAMNDLAKSMQLAQQTNQTVALEQFRTQFRAYAAEAADIRARLNQADAPSGTIQALDTFSDWAIALGKKVGAPVGDLLSTTSTLLKLLPWLLVAAVAGVFLLAYKGKLRKFVG